MLSVYVSAKMLSALSRILRRRSFFTVLSSGAGADGLGVERGNSHDHGKAEAGLQFDRSCNLIYHPPD